MFKNFLNFIETIICMLGNLMFAFIAFYFSTFWISMPITLIIILHLI